MLPVYGQLCMVASYHNASFLPSAIISPLDLLQLNPATYMAQKCIFRISKSKLFIESELFSLTESNSSKQITFYKSDAG